MKSNKIFTKEECIAIASKYPNRSTFRQKEYRAFTQAKNNGWLDEVSPKQCCDLTYDFCYQVAKQYQYFTDFNKKANSVYCKSLNSGWIKDYTWLIHGYYDAESPVHIVYSYEFLDTNSVYVGRTMDERRRYKEHLNDINDTVYKYINSQDGKRCFIYKTLYSNLTAHESQTLEHDMVEEYKKNGWNILNKTKTGSLGGNVVRITKEYCFNEAMKYTKLTDFTKKSPKEYSKALKMKWLEDYTWLEYQVKVHANYSFEECQEKSSLCKNKNEFKKRYYSYYRISKQNGWLESLAYIPQDKKEPIAEYTLDGRFVKIHPDVRGIYYQGMITASIYRVARGYHNSYNNRIWKFEHDVLNDKGEILQQIKICDDFHCIQYDYNGFFIKEYDSVTTASKCDNVAKTSICDSIIGKIIHAKNYVYRYKKDVLDSDGNIIQKIELRKNKVNSELVKYDEYGNFVKHYATQTEAFNDGNKRRVIYWTLLDYWKTSKRNPNNMLLHKSVWRRKQDVLDDKGNILQHINF